MVFLTKIAFFIIAIIFLVVNGQDNSKLNVKFTENNFFKKGIYLPWVKVCSENLPQIPSSYLVKNAYKKNLKKCKNVVKSKNQSYLCRAQLNNGIKILGKVSKFK